MERDVKAVEFRELWRRYKVHGDEKARGRLIVAYSPLVKFIAARMASGLPSQVEKSDLVSYGLLGLIGAIERFDPEREIKFETFAGARIKGAIIDELRSLDWVPRSVRARARRVEQTHAKLEAKLQRARVDGSRVLDRVQHGDLAQRGSVLGLKHWLADAIEALPERERLVVALYYYESLTLMEIGEVLGVTESRVSQLHTKAVIALRSRFQP